MPPLRAIAILSGVWLGASAAFAALPTVAVDVGHFLSEPGATSARGRPEFQFNRDLATAIEAALQARGIAVRLIGADGGEARLSGRTRRAQGANFFLSVHHDSVQPQFLENWEQGGQVRRFSDRHSGFSLFVSRRGIALRESLRCASMLGAALRGAGFRPSLYHAEPIPGESKPFADRENGVHYYDNLVVLKTARSPSVLLEAGVIVNRDEELRLADAAVRQHMAQAIAEGLARCIPAVARRSRQHLRAIRRWRRRF